MNRRNFIKGLLTAAAGFAILPPATTYSRIWRAQRQVDTIDRALVYTIFYNEPIPGHLKDRAIVVEKMIIEGMQEQQGILANLGSWEIDWKA